MSSNPRQRERNRDAEHGHAGHEARGGHHPRLGRRPREGVLRGSRVEARRDVTADHGFRRRPDHAARLRVLDPVRHEPHVGRARLRPEPVSDRLRHRGCPRRARRARCRGRARSSTRAQFRRRPSPAVRTPSVGSYGSFATFSDPDGNSWLLQEITTRLPGRIDAQGTAFASLVRPGECDAAGRGRPRRAREADRGSATRTGPTGTPRT